MMTRTILPPAPQPVAADRISVLLVEDDPVLRETLRAGLANEFRVIGLEDGRSFLPAVYFYRPQIVLMDLNLGTGGEGLTLFDELRSRPELDDVRILFITARRDNESFLDSHAKGANGFLYKPFTIPELRARMRDLLK
jgi:DNA-binding response OmpR family regulator